ncbi:MAG TPA: isochorismatase family cysteine hydrolase [Beijerinckiaceae bacterium]|jgi:nicotinamidase-related amidase
MAHAPLDPRRLALIVVDLQNDFLHPAGAYARGGATSPAIAALPARVKPVMDATRAAGGVVVSTHFTLLPGRDGEPLISDHLRAVRPFLRRGDFAPGSFGHAQVDALGPADHMIEKVAYSAFYASRLEWLLRKLDVAQIAICGIVTNGGVAATLRDGHVRDFDMILLEDGCAAFDRKVHEAAVTSLATAARVTTCAAFAAELGGGA